MPPHEYLTSDLLMIPLHIFLMLVYYNMPVVIAYLGPPPCWPSVLVPVGSFLARVYGVWLHLVGLLYCSGFALNGAVRVLEWRSTRRFERRRVEMGDCEKVGVSDVEATPSTAAGLAEKGDAEEIRQPEASASEKAYWRSMQLVAVLLIYPILYFILKGMLCTPNWPQDSTSICADIDFDIIDVLIHCLAALDGQKDTEVTIMVGVTVAVYIVLALLIPGMVTRCREGWKEDGVAIDAELDREREERKRERARVMVRSKDESDKKPLDGVRRGEK